MKKTIITLTSAVILCLGLTSQAGAASAVKPPAEQWSWTGYFGSFDRPSAQRGLQVYTEVCASCHSLKRVAYRNLIDLGYSIEDIKSFAAEYEVEDGPNSDGEMFMRAAKPSDAFVSPFANNEEAIAANGAFPPDLSLIVKARAGGEGNIAINFIKWIGGRGTASGADYIYHLLTGYIDEDDVEAAIESGDLPHDFEAVEGKGINKWFAGHNITMTAPIDDDAVEYEDGTEATKEQISRDIATFLAWASEPELEKRKSVGIKAIIFLFVMLGLFIAVKRRMWANIKH